ncbi:hypothetical protein ACSSV5_000917 [Psychroflexus sp. MBR-150]
MSHKYLLKTQVGIILFINNIIHSNRYYIYTKRTNSNNLFLTVVKTKFQI